MSMCTVFSWVARKQCLLSPECFLDKTVSLCSSSFCTLKPNLSVISDISWPPTFALQPPVMKRNLFLVLVLESLVGLYRTIQLQLLWHQWLGHSLGYFDVDWFALETNWDHNVILEIAPKHWILDSCWLWELFLSSKGFLPTVVDKMVIWIKSAHSPSFYFTDS